jgi:alpha-L-rhamnosidase
MKKLFFLFIIFLFNFSSFSQVQLKNLLCEHLVNPIGIDVIKPRFSWQLSSGNRNVMQTAYELRVGDKEIQKGKNITWSSGKVLSGQSLYIPYEGKQVESGKRYYWQVRVWDNSNKVSEWSKPSFWEMGLLGGFGMEGKMDRARFYRRYLSCVQVLISVKTLPANKKVQSARLYITSRGLYEAFLNGKRVGDLQLTPGWTSYNNRLQYQVYDVTTMILQGNNALGVMLGSGWFRSNLAYEGNKNLYGKTVALLAQLRINYTDGTNEVIVTDESWKSGVGAISYSEIYHGEIQDARNEKAGWLLANFNDADWSGVQVKNHPTNTLIGHLQ